MNKLTKMTFDQGITGLLLDYCKQSQEDHTRHVPANSIMVRTPPPLQGWRGDARPLHLPSDDGLLRCEDCREVNRALGSETVHGNLGMHPRLSLASLAVPTKPGFSFFCAFRPQTREICRHPIGCKQEQHQHRKVPRRVANTRALEKSSLQATHVGLAPKVRHHH